MSTEQKPGDPADKGLDTFQPTMSHRAGYGDDRLERLIAYLRRQPRATLASGEGALLLAEINRLRRILAALLEPSDAVVENACLALFGAHNWSHDDPGDVVWRADARQRFITQLCAAVAAAEQEVG